jgi:hypothetical protein
MIKYCTHIKMFGLEMFPMISWAKKTNDEYSVKEYMDMGFFDFVFLLRVQ